MLLLIDIGNTNITTGFYEDSIKNVLRLSTALCGKYFDELKNFISNHGLKEPENAVICSVVPETTTLLVETLKKTFGIEPLNVSYKLKTGLKFCIKNPEELGADRIANAVAVRKLYKGHSIVIDFGTATTFCVVLSGGEYRGGVIMPGLSISADVLVEKTSRLPRIELRAPERTIGNDTESNMLSGLILGHAGAVERIIKEIKLSLNKDMNTETVANVIATGGHADLVVPYTEGVREINPFLTLEGLRIIHGFNV